MLFDRFRHLSRLALLFGGNQAYALSYLLILYLYPESSRGVVMTSLIVGVFISSLLISRKANISFLNKRAAYTLFSIVCIASIGLRNEAYFFFILCSQLSVAVIDSELKNKFGSDSVRGVLIRLSSIAAPLVFSPTLVLDDFLIFRMLVPMAFVVCLLGTANNQTATSLYERISLTNYVRLVFYSTFAGYMIPLGMTFLGGSKGMEIISVIMHVTTSAALRIVDYIIFAKSSISRRIAMMIFSAVVLVGGISAAIQSYFYFGIFNLAYLLLIVWICSIVLFAKEMARPS
jgi:hypothetical protein